MANMNAVFAGDATYQKSTRTFGILEPQQPEYTGGAAWRGDATLRVCGAAKYLPVLGRRQ